MSDDGHLARQMEALPVQQIHGIAVGCNDVCCSADQRIAPVSGKDDGRCHGGLEQGIQVCETLDIEHVDLCAHND